MVSPDYSVPSIMIKCFTEAKLFSSKTIQIHENDLEWEIYDKIMFLMENQIIHSRKFQVFLTNRQHTDIYDISQMFKYQ